MEFFLIVYSKNFSSSIFSKSCEKSCLKKSETSLVSMTNQSSSESSSKVLWASAWSDLMTL